MVPPRPETTQLLTQQQEQDLEQMKMFVQLRQDLERVNYIIVNIANLRTQTVIIKVTFSMNSGSKSLLHGQSS